VEPLAPHEKVFVDSDILDDENHGEIACHECHGGNPDDPDWKTAHEGVVKDPTYPDATTACGDCHDEVNENYQDSIHVTLRPYRLKIDKRASTDPVVRDKVEHAMGTHCYHCHSSCGQCHISRPTSVDGGFLDGHLFQRKPPMQEVCTACHGSRIQKEYFGDSRLVWVHRTQRPLSLPEPLPNSNLSLISTGNITYHPSQVFDHAQFRNFIKYVRERFDFVIFDSSPIGKYYDSIVLASHLDGVILVVQAEKTPCYEVKRAKQMLEDRNISILGTVLNRRRYHIPAFIFERFFR
jgi:hypothetical protein